MQYIAIYEQLKIYFDNIDFTAFPSAFRVSWHFLDVAASAQDMSDYGLGRTALHGNMLPSLPDVDIAVGL